MKKIKQNKKGFSMLEVVIAIAILSVGLLTVAQLINKSIVNVLASRDRIIASELAQEGVELVRNLRDNNLAKGQPVFGTQITDGNNGVVNRDSSSVYYGGAFSYTLFNLSGSYWHAIGQGTATKFARRIMVAPDAASGGKTITSIVSWDGAGNPTTTLGNCTVAKKCTYVTDILAPR